MKLLLKSSLMLLFLALVSFAQASLINPTVHTSPRPANSSPSSEEAFIENQFALGGMSMDLIFLGRYGPNGAIAGGEDPFNLLSSGRITVTGYTDPNVTTVTLDWNLAGTGFELWAVYLKAGQQDTLYRVSADQLITDGAGSETATNGLPGGGRGISHISFFGKQGTITVPEGGATAALLGLALAGMALIKRRRS